MFTRYVGLVTTVCLRTSPIAVLVEKCMALLTAFKMACLEVGLSTYICNLEFIFSNFLKVLQRKTLLEEDVDCSLDLPLLADLN